MKSNFLSVLLSFLILLLMAPLSSVASSGGIYGGIGFGSSTLDESVDLADGSTITNVKEDDSDTALSLFLGFQIIKSLAIEVGYIDLGKWSDSGISDGAGFFWFAGPIEAAAESSAFTVAAVGALQFTDKFGGFGKLGIYRADTEIAATDVCCTITVSDSNIDFLLGLGLTYGLSERVTGRLEWIRFKDVGGDLGEISINVLGGSVVFKF